MQIPHRLSAVLAITFVGFPICSHAQGFDEKRVLAKIAEVDANMQEGEIEFSKEGYVLSGGKRTTEQHRNLLRFQKPNRLWQQIIGRGSYSFYDGLDSIRIEPRSNRVSIDRVKPFELQTSYYHLQITNGPSFPLGRGLTNFDNLKISKRGSELIARGETSDSFYTAVLDTKHDYLAQRIERDNKNGNKVHTEFNLAKPILTSSGQWIASHATYHVTRPTGEIASESTFEVYRANFVRPDDSFFTHTFQVDTQIWDGRYGRGVLLRTKRNRPMTKDELTPLTQKLEAEQERVLAQTAEFERQYYRKNTIKLVLISIPVLLVLMTGGFRYVGKRKNPKPIPF